jgi:hypothetical protein
MGRLLKVMSEGKDVGGQPSAAGLQDAALGVGKAGEIGAGERLEVALDGVVAGGPVGGWGAEGGGPLVVRPGLSRAGIPQERLAGGGVRGAAIRQQEGFRLP